MTGYWIAIEYRGTKRFRQADGLAVCPNNRRTYLTNLITGLAKFLIRVETKAELPVLPETIVTEALPDG